MVNQTNARLAWMWLLPMAATLLGVVLLTGVFAGLVLVVGCSITGLEVAAAVIVTLAGLAVWLFRVHGRRWWWPWVAVSVLALVVIVVSLVLGGLILDHTWDGLWFHQEAVIQLAAGWNPFTTDLDEAQVPNEGARARINGYTKATWLWGASLYRMTHRIEVSKGFSLPLAVAAGFAVLACLLILTSLRPTMATLIAFVAAANPVAVTQVLNSFQDGVLASLLTICSAVLVLWIRTGSRIALTMAAAAGVGAAAVKLTGPVYVTIIVGSAVLWLVWKGQWRHNLRAFVIAVVAAAVGLTLLSGGTYLTNSLRHGHPLYPVLGPDRVGIVTAPSHSRYQALVASIFGRSQALSDDRESVERLRSWTDLKPPFRVDREEIGAFLSPWVRVGGWGPWFSGVVLLTIVLIGVTVARRPRVAVCALLMILPLVVSVLVNPYCWKARYAPQSWLVPLVIAVVVLARRHSRLEKVLATALVVAAGINAMMVAWGHGPGVVYTSKQLRTHLLDLGNRQETLEVDFRPFRANRVRLAELGIDFTEVEDDRCSLAVYNGFASAKVIRFEVREDSDGSRVAALQWKPTPGARSYRIAVAGDAASVDVGNSQISKIETTIPEAVVPIGTMRTTLILEICNDLGCCPPKVLLVVESVE